MLGLPLAHGQHGLQRELQPPLLDADAVHCRWPQAVACSPVSPIWLHCGKARGSGQGGAMPQAHQLPHAHTRSPRTTRSRASRHASHLAGLHLAIDAVIAVFAPQRVQQRLEVRGHWALACAWWGTAATTQC